MQTNEMLVYSKRELIAAVQAVEENVKTTIIWSRKDGKIMTLVFRLNPAYPANYLERRQRSIIAKINKLPKECE